MVTTTQEGAAGGETRPALSQQELRQRALEQGARQLAAGPLGQSKDASPGEAVARMEKALDAQSRALEAANAKLDEQAKEVGEVKKLLQVLGQGVVGISDMLKGSEPAKKSAASKGGAAKAAGDAGGK